MKVPAAAQAFADSLPPDDRFAFIVGYTLGRTGSLPPPVALDELRLKLGLRTHQLILRRLPAPLPPHRQARPPRQAVPRLQRSRTVKRTTPPTDSTTSTREMVPGVSGEMWHDDATEADAFKVDSALTLLLHSARVSPPLRDAVLTVDDEIRRLRRLVHELSKETDRG